MVDCLPLMELLTNSLLALIGMGGGHSTLTGLRAFLPLGIVGLIARFELFGAYDLEGTPFAILTNPWVIGILLALAVVEIVADKVAVLDSAQDLVAGPLRVIAGAVIFGAALAQEDTGVIVAGMIGGGALAGATHAVKSVIRPAASASGGTTVNPFLSVFEDVTAAAGTVILAILPILGLLVMAFVLYLVYRVTRRRGRKYKGLRILKD